MIKGSETPRLGPEPLRPLTPATSLGFDAIRFAETFVPDTPLLPWQRWWLIHALELLPDGTFRFRTIVTLVARQNGKTHLLKVLTLFLLHTNRVRLVLGVAQTTSIAKEAFDGVVQMTQDDPDLASEFDKVSQASGVHTMLLRGGRRYRLAVANGDAGRGLSVDLLILDELRTHRDWKAWSALSKTTSARANALTICISNAGDESSVVLNKLRDTALTGDDPDLACFEWSAEDGAELSDRKGWAQANPGLGYTMNERAIKSALATDPPGTFRTEVLCQRVDQLDGAIDLAAWKACADAKGNLESLRSRVAVCLDVSPDLAHVSLAAAAVMDDDRVRVEVVAAWSSTDEARSGLPALLERVNPRAVGWFPGGPAAALAADLRDVKNGVELRAGDVPAVCQGLAEQVGAHRVVQPNDPLLNQQLATTGKTTAGDGWRFTRRGQGHCDAVYAAAGAVHLARTLPASVGRPRIIFAA